MFDSNSFLVIASYHRDGKVRIAAFDELVSNYENETTLDYRRLFELSKLAVIPDKERDLARSKSFSIAERIGAYDFLIERSRDDSLTPEQRLDASCKVASAARYALVDAIKKNDFHAVSKIAECETLPPDLREFAQGKLSELARSTIDLCIRNNDISTLHALPNTIPLSAEDRKRWLSACADVYAKRNDFNGLLNMLKWDGMFSDLSGKIIGLAIEVAGRTGNLEFLLELQSTPGKYCVEASDPLIQTAAGAVESAISAKIDALKGRGDRGWDLKEFIHGHGARFTPANMEKAISALIGVCGNYYDTECLLELVKNKDIPKALSGQALDSFVEICKSQGRFAELVLASKDKWLPKPGRKAAAEAVSDAAVNFANDVLKHEDRYNMAVEGMHGMVYALLPLLTTEEVSPSLRANVLEAAFKRLTFGAFPKIHTFIALEPRLPENLQQKLRSLTAELARGIAISLSTGPLPVESFAARLGVVKPQRSGQLVRAGS